MSHIQCVKHQIGGANSIWDTIGSINKFAEQQKCSTFSIFILHQKVYIDLQHIFVYDEVAHHILTSSKLRQNLAGFPN